MLSKVRKSNRWSAKLLKRAARKLANKYGEDVRRGWKAAWHLHVWGFHESKLTPREIREKIPHIEKLIHLLQQ